jgi:alpha-N-acetylglucosamine transferase
MDDLRHAVAVKGFRYTQLDNGRPMSPVAFLFSRSAIRRYSRIIVSALLLVVLLTLGFHPIRFEHFYYYRHNFNNNSTMVTPAPLVVHELPSLPLAASSGDRAQVGWSQNAYASYATSVEYLCNAPMLFARLKELGTNASSALIYPEIWSENDESTMGHMLNKAKYVYGVHLEP